VYVVVNAVRSTGGAWIVASSGGKEKTSCAMGHCHIGVQAAFGPFKNE
jgi:hypothetical protein